MSASVDDCRVQWDASWCHQCVDPIVLWVCGASTVSSFHLWTTIKSIAKSFWRAAACSERDGWYDWLQTTAEHVVVWSIWAGNHNELSGTGNSSFTRNLASWSMLFWFVLLTEQECMFSTLSQCSRCYAPSAVCCMPGCRTIIVPVLRILFSTVYASKFTTRVRGEIHSTALSRRIRTELGRK